jgi:DNA-binding SARP family transcriptional activator
VRQRRRYRNVVESLYKWGDTSLMGSTDVIYRLLGELEVGRDDRLVDLPGGPTLVVLAALLVNANRRMSKTELIRAAWGDDDVAEAQLHKRVMAVRDLLAQIGRRGDIKTHPRFGYELCVAENDLDVALFQRFVRDAEQAGMDGRAEDEAGSLWRALRLWRGPHPLSNVPSDAFYQETVALEQRRKRAAVRLFDLELARGNHEPILDQVALIAGQYPTDRRLREQLMLAEYRCGHLADVARTYERYQEALAEETGGEPDPQLRALHFAIARGDEPVVAAAESVVARRAGRSARPQRSTAPRSPGSARRARTGTPSSKPACNAATTRWGSWWLMAAATAATTGGGGGPRGARRPPGCAGGRIPRQAGSGARPVLSFQAGTRGRAALAVPFLGGRGDQSRDRADADRLWSARKMCLDVVDGVAGPGPAEFGPGRGRERQFASGHRVYHDHGADPVAGGQGFPPQPDSCDQRLHRLPYVDAIAVNPAGRCGRVVARRPGHRFDQDERAPGADHVRDARQVRARWADALEDPHPGPRGQVGK